MKYHPLEIILCNSYSHDSQSKGNNRGDSDSITGPKAPFSLSFAWLWRVDWAWFRNQKLQVPDTSFDLEPVVPQVPLTSHVWKMLRNYCHHLKGHGCFHEGWMIVLLPEMEHAWTTPSSLVVWDRDQNREEMGREQRCQSRRWSFRASHSKCFWISRDESNLSNTKL